MSGREHYYPPHMPKDTDRTSVRIAWQILDEVRPGVLPLITRFRLASLIAKACEAVDEIQETAARAIQLRDLFKTMDATTIGRIAGISAELVMHLRRLSLGEAANENKEETENT